MNQVSKTLSNAAEQCGLKRVKYTDKYPDSMESVCILPFFGDLRSVAVASSLLLKRYREELRGSKHFILCSWDGFQGLFPYVDEYWTVPDVVVPSLFSKTAGLENNSLVFDSYFRKLTRWFDEVVSVDSFGKYYNNGITQDFFDRFGHIFSFKPAIPSAVILGNNFLKQMSERKEKKVFISPTISINSGKVQLKTAKQFWVVLVNFLLDSGYCPVIQRGSMFHDISSDFVERCIYVSDTSIVAVMAGMRSCDCVLDVFNSTSRIAGLARVPFVALDERKRYMGVKEYEFDDLCISGVPRDYIFTYPTIITDGDALMWKHNLFDCVAPKLEKVINLLDRKHWQTTSEINEKVAYSGVRKIVAKRLGVKHIKVSRI